MNPERHRRVRLITALSAALVLAGALAYTSFSSAAQVSTPSQLARAVRGRPYQVSGTVLPGYTHRGTQLDFRLADRGGTGRAGTGPAGKVRRSILIRYTGAVPDPFRAGREVIVTVVKTGGAFVGQPGSLITKCPSKFASARSTPQG
jgi:cytochrome c-type biogenesis protein CcmE